MTPQKGLLSSKIKKQKTQKQANTKKANDISSLNCITAFVMYGGHLTERLSCYKGTVSSKLLQQKLVLQTIHIKKWTESIAQYLTCSLLHFACHLPIQIHPLFLCLSNQAKNIPLCEMVPVCVQNLKEFRK